MHKALHAIIECADRKMRTDEDFKKFVCHQATPRNMARTVGGFARAGHDVNEKTAVP